VVNDSNKKSRPRHNLGEIEGSGPPAFSSGAARAEALYAECLRLLSEAGIPFVVGGTLAVSACTGLPPPEKECSPITIFSQRYHNAPMPWHCAAI